MPYSPAKRAWFIRRTAKLNAMGLTSRGTPMKQRRRVYGRRKVDYQRLIRGERKACGLTVLGKVPKRIGRNLETKWALLRASMQN